jgi:hypothetical protein
MVCGHLKVFAHDRRPKRLEVAHLAQFRRSSRVASADACIDAQGSYDDRAVWELIVFMVLLKIPIVYLCAVVWYSIRAQPLPPAGASLVPAEPRPHDRPWTRRSRLRRLDPNGRARSRGRGPRRPARKAAR